jgi:hypothetical protein
MFFVKEADNDLIGCSVNVRDTIGNTIIKKKPANDTLAGFYNYDITICGEGGIRTRGTVASTTV